MKPVFARVDIRVGNTEVIVFAITDPDGGQPLDLSTYEARLSIAWDGAPEGGLYWRTGVDPELVMLDQTNPLTKGMVEVTLSPAITRTLPNDRPVTAELELRGAGDGIEDSLLDIELVISRGSNRDG